MNRKLRATALVVAPPSEAFNLLFRDLLQVRGLMPLLIRPRNRRRWSLEERAEFRGHLRRLACISPFLLVLALPGSFLMLPALVWWLDRRRRNHQRPSAAPRK